VPEIISKCCELVKLCEINHSCPFFLRHTVYTDGLYDVYVIHFYVLGINYKTTTLLLDGKRIKLQLWYAV